MTPLEHSILSSQLSHLAQSKLFQLPPHNLPHHERIELTYKRAKAISKIYNLSAHDVETLSEKLWAMHWDNIAALDIAAFTLLTIQYNLAAGILAQYASERTELQRLLSQVLNFEVSAQFLLTELAHGLDAINLETTATLLPSGEFDLHTPRPEAAKYMPATAPFGKMPRVAVVLARLVVDSEDRGIRPFIVVLGNGKTMSTGIVSRLLPKRSGANPVDHAITTFSHVRLPSTALLGSLKKPTDFRLNFLQAIDRIAVGSLAVSVLAIPSLSISAYVVARYSLQRTVTSPGGEQVPIWSFRTQQLPVLHALAQLAVMRAHARWATRVFSQRWNSGIRSSLDLSASYGEADPRDPRVRAGIAAALKASFMHNGQESLLALSERCGARGLFEENQIISIQLESKGACIAEGDTLVLCIRLASELILGRYTLPKSRHPDSLIARYEAGLFAELRQSAKALNHRGDDFNRHILPLCRPYVEVIGHRMAYEAAVDEGVDAPLLALYESWVIKSTVGAGAWFSENAFLKFPHGVTKLRHAEQHALEESAASAAAPHIERYLAMTGAEPYAHAPMLSHEKWDSFCEGLECFRGDAASELPVIPEKSIKLPKDEEWVVVSTKEFGALSARL